VGVDLSLMEVLLPELEARVKGSGMFSGRNTLLITWRGLFQMVETCDLLIRSKAEERVYHVDATIEEMKGRGEDLKELRTLLASLKKAELKGNHMSILKRTGKFRKPHRKIVQAQKKVEVLREKVRRDIERTER
jgi:hypothetical protein